MIRWLIIPERWSSGAQREHILSAIEPVPSALRPGSASYEKAIRDLSDRLRRTTKPEARARLQDRVIEMAEAHKNAKAELDG